MENQELIKQVTEKAEKWLTPAYDAETCQIRNSYTNNIQFYITTYSINHFLILFHYTYKIYSKTLDFPSHISYICNVVRTEKILLLKP